MLEFLRYARQELSFLKLLSTLGAVFLLYSIVYISKGTAFIDKYGYYPPLAIGILYGARKCASSLRTEYFNLTWNHQVSSKQSSLSLALGKIFGPSILPNIIALFCIVLTLLAQHANNSLKIEDGVLNTLRIIAACALSFGFSSILFRLSPLIRIQIAHGLAILFSVMGLSNMNMEFIYYFSWYDFPMESIEIKVVYLLSLIFFGVLVGSRMIGRELADKQFFYAWPLFVLFAAFFFGGFGARFGHIGISFAIILCLSVISWATFLMEEKDRYFASIFILVFLSLNVLAYNYVPPFTTDQVMMQGIINGLYFPMYLVMFLWRDFFVIASIKAKFKPVVAVLVSIFYMASIYGLIPSLLRVMGLTEWTVLIIPNAYKLPLEDYQTNLLVASQIVITATLLFYIKTKNKKKMERILNS